MNTQSYIGIVPRRYDTKNGPEQSHPGDGMQ